MNTDKTRFICWFLRGLCKRFNTSGVKPLFLSTFFFKNRRYTQINADEELDIICAPKRSSAVKNLKFVFLQETPWTRVYNENMKVSFPNPYSGAGTGAPSPYFPLPAFKIDRMRCPHNQRMKILLPRRPSPYFQIRRHELSNHNEEMKIPLPLAPSP
jgi:hypothetical protein